MLENLVIIDFNNIIEEAKKTKEEGYRFAAMTCEHLGETYDLTYHYDLDHVMKNVRVSVKKEDKIPSISHIFLAAFLSENEFQDLYGLTFENLTIDYKSKLYLAEDAPEAPMAKK